MSDGLPDRMRELAEMMARARLADAAMLARSEGLMTELAIRTSQIECKRCIGDLDAPTIAGFEATIGVAPCTCLIRCTRPCCRPPDPLADLEEGL